MPNPHTPRTSPSSEIDSSRTADELAVYRLTGRFADCAVRSDMIAFRRLWSPEGVWEITAPNAAIARGVDEIVALMSRLMSQWDFFVQLVHSGVVELDGDRASARFVMREFARNESKKMYYDNMAVYEDELVRDATAQDGWRYLRRTYHYVWVDESPIGGRSFALPARLGVE